MGFAEAMVAIAAIMVFGGLIGGKSKGETSKVRRERAEQLRVAEEDVRDLKERVQVLERLATDDGARLTHEIERLRDRDRV